MLRVKWQALGISFSPSDDRTLEFAGTWRMPIGQAGGPVKVSLVEERGDGD